MRAASLSRPGQLIATTLPEPPPPAARQALVRVLRVGVCGTDLHAFRGHQPMMRYPVILGHELAVEVLALGPDSSGNGRANLHRDPTDSDAADVQVGDRCTIIPYIDCGNCPTCAQGRTNCCENLCVLGVHVDGGLRERFVLPARLLLPANDLDDDQLALVEMLAVGAHAVARAQIGLGTTVAVIGLGPIGLGIALAAVNEGATVVGADLDAGRLSTLDASGMARTVAAGEGLEERLRAEFGGELPSVVFDATGNAASMVAAPGFAAPGGRVTFVGHTKGTLAIDNQTIHRKELTLLASRNAVRADFERVLQHLRSGVHDPRRWINARTDLGGVVDDLPRWAAGGGGVVKAMVHLA